MTHIVKIAPSILSADFTRLADEISSVEKAGADLIHIDVMDGHFVPNLTLGPPIVEAIRSVTRLPLDVHLMITNPDTYVSGFRETGADILTIHVETCPHLHRTIHAIKDLGAKAGVALNPGTPLTSVAEIVHDIDVLLIMSVNPGFGGQCFIPSSVDKVRRARTLIVERSSEAVIEVDGGISAENASAVFHAGATILVAGSAIFHAPQYDDAIDGMRNACAAHPSSVEAQRA